MKRKIVLALDSFKGCLNSLEVEETVAQAILEKYPEDKVISIPIADGGEGILDVMVRMTGGHLVDVEVHDALMRPMKAAYGVLGDGVTAVVEMAQASGLPRLSVAERNPMETTTYGTGEIIRKVIAAGYRSIVMGIGGSATNDAGMGMMQALGAKFMDAQGNVLSTGCGKLLQRVDAVDLSSFYDTVEGVDFVTACDVNNPFCGKEGAVAVYAPQKGATEEMVWVLEQGMLHYRNVITSITGKDITHLPGAGAAGGMGGCLFAFFSSCLYPGVDLILEQMKFREKMEGVSLMITGEGKADLQTLMGKVPAGVLKIGKERNVPVVLMAGAVDGKEKLLAAGFSKVVEVSPKEMPLAEVMRPDVARELIYRATRRFLADWS